MAKKLIKIIKVGKVYWWVNKTDQDPPAGGKEFISVSEVIKDINSRVRDYTIQEEYETKPIEHYDEDEEENH